MVQHHAFRFACSARGVDDRRQLISGNLRSPAPVLGNIRVTGCGNQRLIAQNLAVQIAGRRHRNHVFEARHALTRFRDLPGLRFALA